MPVPEQILDYFADHIPDTLYDALAIFLEHLFTIYRAVRDVFAHLMQTNAGTEPTATYEVAQLILPPLMSVIAIYFALMSAWRTTTSFFRTAAFLIKWGSLLGLLAMGAGFFAGRGPPVDVATILQTASQLLNDQAGDRDAGGILGSLFGSSQSSTGGGRGSAKRRRAKKTREDRPSMFDSFLKHEEWKKGQQQTNEAQTYVEQVVNAGQKAVNEGAGFLNLIFGNRQADGEDAQNEWRDNREGPARRTRSQTRARGRR